MMHETSCRIERMDVPERSSHIYKTLSNIELEKLAESKSCSQRADPKDDMYHLKLARARILDRVKKSVGNHIDDMRLVMELNQRIWALDKKDHIRAMNYRRI